MERHALTFDVRPGTEAAVDKILSDYPRPATAVDGSTRLLATSVFRWENHIVRVMDIEGDIRVAARHLAAEPAIQQTERALNPYLAEPRDLDDPAAAGRFFRTAAMVRVIHRVTHPDLLPDEPERSRRTRVALRYPVRPGQGEAVAGLLSAAKELPVRATRTRTAMASTTVFRRGDFVIRLAELAGDPEEGLAHLSRVISRAPSTPELNALMEPGCVLTDEEGCRAFLASARLILLTDRRAAEAA